MRRSEIMEFNQILELIDHVSASELTAFTYETADLTLSMEHGKPQIIQGVMGETVENIPAAGMAGGTIFSGIFNQPYDIKTKETKRGVLLTMIPAAVIILFIRQPFEGLVYSQMLLAVQLPVTIFTQIYLTASKKVMGKYVNSRRLNFLLLVIAVIVTGLNIALLFV